MATTDVEIVIRVIDMQITVDRIEENIIVFVTQDGKTFEIPKDIFPTLSEGDVITVSVDASVNNMKKQELNTRLQNLFNK